MRDLATAASKQHFMYYTKFKSVRLDSLDLQDADAGDEISLQEFLASMTASPAPECAIQYLISIMLGGLSAKAWTDVVINHSYTALHNNIDCMAVKPDFCKVLITDFPSSTELLELRHSLHNQEDS